MNIRENSITTMIVNSEDNQRNFEITRILSGDGVTGTGDALFFTICASTSATGDFRIDATSFHILNHLSSLGFSKVSVMNLFSKITASRMSSRNLKVDEEMISYIEERFKEKHFGDTKVIIAWGNSMQKSDAANLSKKRIVQLYQKYHPGKPLYELVSANGDERFGHNVHPLFLGIHTSPNIEWRLREWIPPKELLEYKSKSVSTKMSKEKSTKKEKI